MHAFVLVAVISASGCIRLTDFAHAPTEELLSNADAAADAGAPALGDGHVGIQVGQALATDEFGVSLLYFGTAPPADFRVTDARVTHPDGIALTSTNQSALVNPEGGASRRAFAGSVQFGRVGGSSYERLKAGDADLTIVVTVFASGEIRELQYTLSRRTKRLPFLLSTR